MPTLCFIIHGIGSQNQDFADPLKKGIDRELVRLIKAEASKNSTWAGVEPSKLVTYHGLYWANIGTDAQANLYRKLYPDIFTEESWFKSTWNVVAKFSLFRQLSVNLLGDVFGYLGQFQQQIKQVVFSQIERALQPAYSSGEPVSLVLVGHSLGSVILHDLVGGFLRYSYADFDQLVGRTSVFTMGSPLSLFSLVAERAKPDRFRSWVNILHERDPVAFPMGKLDEFVSVRDARIGAWRWNPLALHASYWRHPEVHRLIAQEIIAHRRDGIGAVPKAAPGRVPSEIFHSLSGGTNMAGLAECYVDFRKVPFTDLILSAREIDFCNIYGGQWLSAYAQDFEKALMRPEVVMRACITAPGSPALQALAQHFGGKKVADLESKIQEGTQTLLDIYNRARKHSSSPGRLKIYHCRNMINHSFYRFDDLLYFTPRPLSSSKNAATPIPCFSFRRTNAVSGANDWMMRDFEELLKVPNDVTVAFDSGP